MKPCARLCSGKWPWFRVYEGSLDHTCIRKTFNGKSKYSVLKCLLTNHQAHKLLTSSSSSKVIPLSLALPLKCAPAISDPQRHCYQKGDSSFLLEADPPFHRFFRTPDLAPSNVAWKKPHPMAPYKFEALIVPSLLQACNFAFSLRRYWGGAFCGHVVELPDMSLAGAKRC